MQERLSRLLFGNRDWLRPRKAGLQYLLLLIGVFAATWLSQMAAFLYATAGTPVYSIGPLAVMASAVVSVIAYMVVTERLWITREYAHTAIFTGGLIVLYIARFLGY